MRMLGQERWVSDINTLNSEALIANVEALWSERERVRCDLRVRMAEVEQRANENAILIQRVIEAR